MDLPVYATLELNSSSHPTPRKGDTRRAQIRVSLHAYTGCHGARAATLLGDR